MTDPNSASLEDTLAAYQAKTAAVKPTGSLEETLAAYSNATTPAAQNQAGTLGDTLSRNGAAAPKTNKGLVNDTLVGLGKGAMQIFSATTGLADIPAG